MNLKELRYLKFALCREMLESVNLIKNFKPEISERFIAPLKKCKRLLITGEGSSRIFPGKHFKDLVLSNISDCEVIVEGATQAIDYQLANHIVFGISNSGKTNELVNLYHVLQEKRHPYLFSLTANQGSLITHLSIDSEVLSCGAEVAVAATKSVMEQALFFESLFYNYQKEAMLHLGGLAESIRHTLEMTIDTQIIQAICQAPIVYFAGRNNGVAEELALKTNEITRKKSVFLEGTYALHGIEEVMQKGEVLIIVDPFEQEEQKFHDVIQKGAQVQVIAISSRRTIFPTILLPENREYHPYIELAGGWNLLVEIGISLGIDLDKPIRARKIGNEV